MLAGRAFEEVDTRVVESELGLGNETTVVVSDVLRRIAERVDVAALEAEFEKQCEIVPPQKTLPTLARELSCSQVGFCLKEPAKESLEQPMHLVADALARMLGAKSVFAQRYEKDILDSNMFFGVCFYHRETRLHAESFRLCIGTGGRQVLWYLTDGHDGSYRDWWLNDVRPCLSRMTYSIIEVDGLACPDMLMRHKFGFKVMRLARSHKADIVRIRRASLARRCWKKFDIELHETLLEFRKDWSKAKNEWITTLQPPMESRKRKGPPSSAMSDLLKMCKKPRMTKKETKKEVKGEPEETKKETKTETKKEVKSELAHDGFDPGAALYDEGAVAEHLAAAGEEEEEEESDGVSGIDEEHHIDRGSDRSQQRLQQVAGNNTRQRAEQQLQQQQQEGQLHQCYQRWQWCQGQREQCYQW